MISAVIHIFIFVCTVATFVFVTDKCQKFFNIKSFSFTQLSVLRSYQHSESYSVLFKDDMQRFCDYLK